MAMCTVPAPDGKGRIAPDDIDDKHAFSTIDHRTIKGLLDSYPEVVPEKLAELEKQRLEVIPNAVKERDPPYLTKDELATLMDWKLAHGKFRPNLKKLIQQNDDETVKKHTRKGFGILSECPPPEGRYIKTLQSSIMTLSKLRGVGPATASLLLSVYDPDRYPFFSEELHWWSLGHLPATAAYFHFSYSVAEYIGLYDFVNAAQERFRSAYDAEVSALELEKVAYVLGKQGAEIRKGTATDIAKSTSRKRKAEAEIDAGEKDKQVQSMSTQTTATGGATTSTRRSTRRRH